MDNRKPSSTNTTRQLCIKELSQEIASLTKELDDLLIQELAETTKSGFKIGDTMLITNNHHGLQGSEGTIVKLSRNQATVKLQDGTIIQRVQSNPNIVP
jgi:hypothetical protein